MRKIFVLLGIIITILVVNFSLWFVHTRTIHRAVTVLKNNLALYGINLYYEDLYFDSFKSWSVQGTLKSVVITNDMRNITRVAEIEAVNFSSFPFSEFIEISIPQSINYKKNALGAKEELLRIDFPNGKPTFEIDFITSLNSTNDSISEHDNNPFFVNIKKLSYYDSGFEVLNRENGENYMHSGNNKLEFINVGKDGLRAVDFEMKFSDMSNTPKFHNPSMEVSDELMHKLSVKSDFYVKGNFSMLVSDEQLEYINEMKRIGKDANIKKFLDTYKFKFDNFDVVTNDYSLHVSGEVQKYLNVFLPTFNLKVTVANYNNLVDLYFSSLNLAVEEMKKIPDSPVQEKVNDSQVTKVKSILSKFSEGNETLNMHFTGTKDGVFEISGRSLVEVWTELQAIIFANIKEEAPQKKVK